jgi:hypothetical protein
MHLKVLLKLKKTLKTLFWAKKKKNQKTPKNKKTQKTHWAGFFFKKPGFFPTLHEGDAGRRILGRHPQAGDEPQAPRGRPGPAPALRPRLAAQALHRLTQHSHVRVRGILFFLSRISLVFLLLNKRLRCTYAY